MTPSPEAIAHAVAYNRGRGFDSDRIETIQRVTGVATIDGLWGPLTVTAVWRWQADRGLRVDGMVGPETLAAIDEAATSGAGRSVPDSRGSAGSVPPAPAMVTVIRGCWIDESPSTVLSDGYFDRLVAMGLQTISIMLNHSTASGASRPWQPRWTAAQLQTVGQRAADRDIDVVGTVWPLPDSDSIAALIAAVPELLRAAGAKGLEVDAEGNWSEKHLGGFSTLGEAAKTLADRMREVAAPLGAELELTTFPYHPENGPHATLAPLVDRLFPQAYSVSARGHEAVPFTGHTISPGRMQQVTLERARTVPGVSTGAVEVGCGLAAYHQVWPSHTGEQAMGVAYDEALKLGVRRVRYWSSTWINDQDYASAFLRSKVPS